VKKVKSEKRKRVQGVEGEEQVSEGICRLKAKGAWSGERVVTNYSPSP
jgi:hypothetical protein